MPSVNSIDVTIIGGGVVGLSLAFGLLQAGHRVTVLDGKDDDLSASQGNFGLVWLQGKGSDFAPYAHWTRDAVAAWPKFSDQLARITGKDVSLQQTGGYEFFTDLSELDAFSATLAKQQTHLGNRFSYEIFTGKDVRRTIPGIGQHVVGASYCELDGHINPLRLLHMLKLAVVLLGGSIVANSKVTQIDSAPGTGFKLTLHNKEKMSAHRVVICAGLGANTLAEQLGFKTRVHPQRGELLITEKIAHRLPFLSSTIRQVDEGGIQIGGTQADAGYNDADSPPVMTKLAHHAVTVFPALSDLRVLRSWGALRVMSPDAYPVYAQSKTHPEAFMVTCHSGVTLASLHATALVDWMDNTENASNLEAFDEDRFTISSAA